MKFYSLVVIFLAALIAMQSPVQAAESKIAILNIQQIMKDSTAAKSVRDQLDAKRKSFESEMAKKEEDLRKEDQDLSKQRSVLAPEAFEKKLKDFREKASVAQRDVAAKRSQLDNAFTNAVNDIQKVVTDIVTQLAKDKGYSLVVPTSQLVWADPALDISKEVLTQLNQKLSKVTVKF